MHPWLRRISVSLVPGSATPLLRAFADRLLRDFRRLGHQVQSSPGASTDAILITARFGEVIRWREALLFSARRRFGLTRLPTVFTLMHVHPASLERTLAHFEAALAKDPPDPTNYAFPGLAATAYRVLHEQGRRGGPLLALLRLVQAQAKGLRIVLVVGDEHLLAAYHFDLVGAHPRTEADDEDLFYADTVLRIVTAVSTREVTEHAVAGGLIPQAQWQQLDTPRAMRAAGREFGARRFFTEMVRIADLIRVPALSDAVARQYSEGCFATWDPTLGALISTVTGSARPVEKGNIGDDDLAVIVGVRPDGRGALVQHVEGTANAPPSSEAVELIAMDRALPTSALGPPWTVAGKVPVIRSKLHGHRGIGAYDPRRVEYVALELPYHRYLVSCATDAQAQGVSRAFARSEALRHPDDPRRVVFTVLPGHGVVIAEKWVEGKAPFQAIWESMDAGALQTQSRVPQGPMEYVPGSDGRMVLHTG